MGGALTISAYSPGTATITVYGDLRLWSTGVGSVGVSVSDPAPTPTPNTPSDGSSDGGASKGSGSGAVSGSVSVSDAGVTATSSTGRVLSALVSGGDAAKVSEGAEAASEGEVSLVRLGDTPVSEALAAIAGTKNTVCFWSGDSLETADYLWSFAGSDLAVESVADVDLGVEDATDSQERLAEALPGVTYRAIDFANEGAYPCPAMFGYRVSNVFANGERLALYFYDQKADSLVLVQRGVEVTEGYATFKIDHGSLWVLADDDSLEGPLSDEVEVGSEVKAATTRETAKRSVDSVPVGVIVGGACTAALAAAIVTVAVRSRRKAVRDGNAASGGIEVGDAPNGEVLRNRRMSGSDDVRRFEDEREER